MLTQKCTGPFYLCANIERQQDSKTLMPELQGTVSTFFLQFAFNFSLELTKTLILPELVELTKDEQLVVRQAGIQTVSNILTLLDDGRLFNAVIDRIHMNVNFVFDVINCSSSLDIRPPKHASASSLSEPVPDLLSSNPFKPRLANASLSLTHHHMVFHVPNLLCHGIDEGNNVH